MRLFTFAMMVGVMTLAGCSKTDDVKTLNKAIVGKWADVENNEESREFEGADLSAANPRRRLRYRNDAHPKEEAGFSYFLDREGGIKIYIEDAFPNEGIRNVKPQVRVNVVKHRTWVVLSGTSEREVEVVLPHWTKLRRPFDPVLSPGLTLPGCSLEGTVAISGDELILTLSKGFGDLEPADQRPYRYRRTR